MENIFNQLMNWTYLSIVLVYAKDSKNKTKKKPQNTKFQADEFFGQRTCKIDNEKSYCTGIILEQVHCAVVYFTCFNGHTWKLLVNGAGM